MEQPAPLGAAPVSDYSADIFGRSELPDTSKWDTASRVAAAMYKIGAALTQADALRERIAEGETLTEKESQFLAKVDRLLEEGLPFGDNQEPGK